MEFKTLNVSIDEMLESMAEKDCDRIKKMHCVLFYDTEMALNIDTLRDDVYARFGRPQVFNDYMTALHVYANSPCPASQIIHADDNKELLEKIKQCDKNMANSNWVLKNLIPLI